MLAVEIMKLLEQQGELADTDIADALSSFGLLEKNHSAMHPGLMHPRYRVSTVSLNEVRNVLRILSQLDLVASRMRAKLTVYELAELGKRLLSESQRRS